MTSSLDRLLSPATLRLIVAVQDLGGIGAAARSQGMTQPAASRLLSAVERGVHTRLLTRSPRGTRLTPAGLALAAQSRLVLAEQDRLLRTASELATPAPERLELAASRTVGEHLVPDWLGAQAAAHPDTWVSFRFDNSAAVIGWVQDGTVPLGFIEDPAPPRGLHSEELLQDELVVIVPPAHGWAGATVTPEQLAATPLVERERGSGTRATLDTALPKRARPVAVLDSNPAIVRAVAAGVGPAVLSTLAVSSALGSGLVAAADFSGPPLRRPLLAITRQDAALPAPAAAFLDLVRTASKPTTKPSASGTGA